MAKRALIGSTGFVGGNLQQQSDFDAVFNSRNIGELAGGSFDTIVCAGAPAAKWLANKDPQSDKQSLSRLSDAIDRVACGQFVLISTIDVYPVLSGADESYECGHHPNHAYGTNRTWLEERVRARFPTALIVRLPALFGPGLKKNVLYDLLHAHEIDAINPDSTFQWYGVARLTQDVEVAQERGLTLVNLFTEPVQTREIARLFPRLELGRTKGPEMHYDLTTRHAALFGGANGYVQDRYGVLRDITQYVAGERDKASV